ncbi:glycosyltransferase [uncultured Bacteroides sp.]|uniref:glycosyltransferase family 2 protein n=1 Tax=uncultured Bacteroides sp. TaxID=162156 RepID=UPI002628DB85|nr:glycosyltransferase [uncultured Bacteroides sp.]
MITIDINSITCILAGICGIFFIIQLIYIFCLYNRIHRRSKHLQIDVSDELPPLSVLIVTKDSGSMLQENLPAILEQDYPDFEVIVINDKSAGEDEDILKLLEQKYKNLYHTFIPETARYVSRKKLGIAMGIRASKNEWLVVTEPTCRPISNQWLRSLAKQMTPSTDVVLGYSNYFPQKGWFAKRITTGLFFESLRFLCMALAGNPYMGIGRNLAYRKSVYLKHKGFSDHLQLQRGEDDLFVNAVANKSNTRVALGADSIIRMSIPPFRRIWHEDMMNYMVTSHYYKGSAKFWNGLETWTCALFHLIVIGGLTMSIIEQQWIVGGIILLCWIIRFTLFLLVLNKAAHDLQEKIGCILPLFDILRPIWSLQKQLQYRFRDKRDFIRK